MRNERWMWWLVAMAVTPRVSAQSQDDAERRGLIERAFAARDHGDHAGALSLLRQAAALRMTPSLQVFLAQEERLTGDLLRALDDARRALADLTENAALAHRDDLLAQCGSLIAQLEAATARVTVAVPADRPAGTRVTLNGRPLASSSWGAAVDVLPGEVALVVEAPGRVTVHEQVTLTAGRARTMPVTLTPEPPVVARTTTAVVDVRPVVPPVTEPPPRPAPASRGAGAGPWVVMGVGAVSFVMAGVFYGLRQGALSDRDAACGSTEGVCEGTSSAVSTAMQRQGDASTFNTLTNVSLGIGAAAVVGGGLWWLLGRGGSERASTAGVWVAPGRDGVAIGWQGRM